MWVFAGSVIGTGWKRKEIIREKLRKTRVYRRKGKGSAHLYEAVSLYITVKANKHFKD